jgi:inorganic pyrophosphatase
MPNSIANQDWSKLCRLFKPHPWHGVPIGSEAPARVTCYIEIVPTDTVKYEADKISGYLRVDRPQRYSNICPTLYGFIPQTYCAEAFAAYVSPKLGGGHLRADHDPLDICVLSERELSHGDVLVEAIPIGGLRTLDGDAVDDKLLAVLADDAVYGAWSDIADVPDAVLERLKHYFLTYKHSTTATHAAVSIAGVYGRQEAHEAIEQAHEEYKNQFGEIRQCLSLLRGE